MRTTKHIWIGLIFLCFMITLIMFSVVFWQHVTSVSALPPLLAEGLNGQVTHGC